MLSWKPSLILASAISALAGCSISTPFRWPGYSPETGVTAVSGGQTVLVAITHAVVLPDKRAAFDAQTDRVFSSLPGTPGLIGYSIRKQVFGDQLWTATIWSDEAALNSFTISSQHQTAVDAASSALKSARFRRFTLQVKELPLNWERALKVLDDGATPPSKY